MALVLSLLVLVIHEMVGRQRAHATWRPRLLLEVSHDSLIDAGFTKSSLIGSSIAVLVGQDRPHVVRQSASLGSVDAQKFRRLGPAASVMLIIV